MLILISPAKTLDMSPVTTDATQPRLLDDTEKLLRTLCRKSPAKLRELMSISDKLADLNYARYQACCLPLTPENAKPALLAFRGDVYQDLGADDFSEREFDFANRQIRILSGLYGMLRPRDLMQAYRLEMGTCLPTRRGKNLYQFWGNRITKLLNEDLATDPTGLVLNLASQEYFRSVNPAKIAGRVLTIHFKEMHAGKPRVVSFTAKRARGKLARLITLEGITAAEPLKEFVVNDHRYVAELSTTDDWVYLKD